MFHQSQTSEILAIKSLSGTKLRMSQNLTKSNGILWVPWDYDTQILSNLIISKILCFRGRLFRGKTRKDLTRSIWPCGGGLINPMLTWMSLNTYINWWFIPYLYLPFMVKLGMVYYCLINRQWGGWAQHVGLVRQLFCAAKDLGLINQEEGCNCPKLMPKMSVYSC